MRIWIFISLSVLLNLQLRATEMTDLKTQFEAIFLKRTDAEKISASKDFRENLKNYLLERDPMNADLSELKMYSEKEKHERFRILNWNVPLSYENHYECMFVLPTIDESYKVITCNKTRKDLSKVENRTLSAKDWPGALYYEIIPLSKKNDAQFILLGWDGKDRASNRKVLEVITISDRNIKFGANIFKEFERPIKRYIMEYRDDAVAGLSYDEKYKRIVFDHLSPPRQDLEGQFQFYGPDMTFDAFVLKKGQLYFRENVKFVRERHAKDNNFYDPRKK
ncbi:MAG: hypothetical protein HKN39_06615 [Flavobacteriales bacterium]|nr:hypothetical protein [Flavobacteriales bacterium]